MYIQELPVIPETSLPATPEPEFKLVIFGGRDFGDHKLADQEFRNLVAILKKSVRPDTHLHIVSGCARGADQIGEWLAQQYRLDVFQYPAQWTRPDGSTDKGAGFARNVEMARIADAGLCFWDGESRGTKHMLDTMQELGKPVRVIHY